MIMNASSEKIRIIDRDFEIRYVPNLEDLECVNAEAGLIEIREGLPDYQRRRMKVHAIVHGILEITGVSEIIGERIEEAICIALEQMANVIWQAD